MKQQLGTKAIIMEVSVISREIAVVNQLMIMHDTAKSNNYRCLQFRQIEGSIKDSKNIVTSL